MYNTLEFFKMLRLLQADLNYSRIKDPEEKMRYFVRKHHTSIVKYIKNSMKILARSIDKHQRIGIDILVPEWQRLFIEHAQVLYIDCEPDVLKTNSHKILEFLNQVLAKVSFDWTDKNSLFVLANYYSMRSLIHMINGREKHFQSDFKHMIFLMNEQTGEYLMTELRNNNPMIRMFLQISFVLSVMSLPANMLRPSDDGNVCTQLLHMFVQNIKDSLHKYSQQLSDDTPDMKRNAELDKLVYELWNEFELEQRLCQHIGQRDWKIFVTLFEFADTEFNYENLVETMMPFVNVVHQNMHYYSNLSHVIFDLNSKVALEETESGGRCYVADSHIQAEEQILVEKPASCVLFQEYFRLMCSTCQKQIVTAFPCSGCTEMVFCSGECSKIAVQQYHWLECGCYMKMIGNDQFTVPHVVRIYSIVGIDTLLKQIQRDENIMLGLEEPEPAKSNGKIVENYMECFSGLSKAEFLAQLDKDDPETEGNRQAFSEALNSLLVHRWSRQSDREIIHSIWALNVVALFILRDGLPLEFIEKHNLGKLAAMVEIITCRLLSICTNGFGWLDSLDRDGEPITNSEGDQYLRLGSSICFVGSFFNHSCKPNVTWTITKDIGLQMYSTRPIQPKEPLCISYGPRYPSTFNERQKSLKENYCFLCQCELCLSDASELPTTLSCLNPDIDCNGPLVLNKQHSCLKCGYKASHAEYSLYLNRLNAFRDQFKEFFKKLEFKHGRSHQNILNKVMFYTAGALKRKSQKLLLNLKGILQNTSYGSSTLEQLRRAFDSIHDIIYKGSFNLLEYSVEMLKAYKWEHYQNSEKIFEVVKIIIDCLENAHPDAVLLSQIGDDIVKNIEFCGEYFADYFQHTYPDKNYDNSALNAIEHLKRIDLTLVNILKPIAVKAHKQKTDSNSEKLTQKDKPVALYVDMFMNAQKRILMYDSQED